MFRSTIKHSYVKQNINNNKSSLRVLNFEGSDNIIFQQNHTQKKKPIVRPTNLFYVFSLSLLVFMSHLHHYLNGICIWPLSNKRKKRWNGRVKLSEEYQWSYSQHVTSLLGNVLWIFRHSVSLSYIIVTQDQTNRIISGRFYGVLTDQIISRPFMAFPLQSPIYFLSSFHLFQQGRTLFRRYFKINVAKL